MRKQQYLKMWEDRGLALIWLDLDIQKNKEIKKITNHGRDKLIYLFDKGFVKVFVSKDDWQKEKIAGKIFFTDYQFARKTLIEARKEMKGILLYYRKLWDIDFKKIDYTELVNHFNRLLSYYSKFLVYFELTQPQRTELIEKELQKKYNNLEIKVKSNIFTQEKKDWERLTKIARSKGFGATETKKAIKKYSSKYFFLETFETFQVLDEKVVSKRLKEEMLKETGNNKNLIQKLKIKDKLINIISDYAALRADLSQYWTTPVVLVKLKFFKEIGRRLRISPKILEFMLRSELDRVLLLKKLDFKIRKDKFALISDNYQYRFLYSRNYRKLCQQLKKEERKTEVGIIANQGVARGLAKIISSEYSLKKQFSKFKDGDILVTQMTTPNYLPILRKASAIITDEGGILCHATIVSRELNIPCIVGTKNATKVFKDGDLIEVDANKGTIKIIKN